MALSGCYALVKYLTVIINCIFWLAGIAVVAVSTWMMVDPTFYLSVTQQTTHYHTGLIVLLAIGILTFLVGFFGCCGALKESMCLLLSFIALLLIVLAAEVAAGAWAYVHRDALVDSLRENVKYTVKNEYGVVQSRTEIIDAIQIGLKCCGAEGSHDWAQSKYDKTNTKQDVLSLTASAVGINYNIPESCCRQRGSDFCKASKQAGFTSYINPEIYSEGCIDKLIDILKQQANIVLAVGLTIVALQILALLFAFILCCAIRNTDHFKA